VAEAVVDDLDDLRSPFRLRCAGEALTGLDEGIDRYRFAIGGPWIEPLPELTAQTRVHPLVFGYPWRELTEIEIASPARFVPSEAPPPVEIASSLGRYSLEISRTDAGYRVERDLTWPRVGIRPDHYADLRAFLEQVRRADSAVLEFTRVGAQP
jgi:hypothetical protein